VPPGGKSAELDPNPNYKKKDSVLHERSAEAEEAINHHRITVEVDQFSINLSAESQPSLRSDWEGRNKS
jgi:hypothetical protein